MYRPPLIGFFLGIIIDVVLWFSGPFSHDSVLLKFLCVISTPVAHIVSWITGWSFHQESGIMLYVFAIPITIPLLGLLLGFLYTVVSNLINKSRSTDR